LKTHFKIRRTRSH